jgi:hypothetical protein
MSIDITRQELYDLVWSRPIMHVAKDFGISGSMLGRICKERNVPRPPRGYWASLQATSAKKIGRFIKPSLPNMPEPDQSFNSLIHKEYADREAARTDDFDPDDLGDPVKPPPLPPSESLVEFRERIEAIFPVLPALESINAIHPFVQKLMDYDVTLVALKRRGGWDSPNYQDEKGKLCLAWLNLLLHSFEFLGFEPTVRGKKHFTFQLSFLRHHKGFVFFIGERNLPPLQRRVLKRNQSRAYCFRWDQETEKFTKGDTCYEFEAISTDCIKQIVMDVVMYDEKEYRDGIVSSYRWNVERRNNEIERREYEIQLAVAKKRKALKKLLASRVELMNEAVSNMNSADKIRDLIATMQAKAEATGGTIKGMKRWIGWASHHANTIDPRSRSLEGFEVWLKKFRLKH